MITYVAIQVKLESLKSEASEQVAVIMESEFIPSKS